VAQPAARLEAVDGDLTEQVVDAVVNAANSSLLGGSGVDGALHRAAGPALLAECRALRDSVLPEGLPVGRAVTTGAGDLAARWVIHTVGPDRHRGETDPELLASCFRTSLQEAVRVGARSVAFPAISAGAYGWDVAEVARVAVGTVRRAPELARLHLVRFVLFGPLAHAAFVAELSGT
jgi:O-acetyl-ADP-ribose deacetylase